MSARLYVPVAVCDLPERVHGVVCQFYVCYSSGREARYSGRIGAVSCLFDALVDRLSSDSSISDVRVYLPSGRFLCECYR